MAFLPDEKSIAPYVQSILQRSGGLFLYVECVRQELDEGRLSLDQLDHFPAGLGGVYSRFFRRQCPDPEAYRQTLRPLLEMVLAAQGPFPLDLVRPALNWDAYRLAQALDSTGSFFPVLDNHVRPFHRSLIEWLTDRNNSGPYFVDRAKGHELIADACWKEFRCDPCTLSPYGLTHLADHLIETRRYEDLIELVTSPELAMMSKWIERGDGDKALDCLIPLTEHMKGKRRLRKISAALATQIARVHSLRGQYDDAERWLKHAAELTSWWHGRRARAVALHELGSLHLYRGLIEQARQYYRQAQLLSVWGLPVYKDVHAAALLGLATVSLEQGHIKATVRRSIRILCSAIVRNEVRHIVAGKRLMGQALLKHGYFSQAAIHLKDAAVLAERFDVALETPKLLSLLGRLEYENALLQGTNLTEARGFLEKATAKAETVHDVITLAQATTALAWCDLHDGTGEDTISRFEEVKRGLPAGRHHDLRHAIDVGVAAAHHELGDLATARKLYEAAIESSPDGAVSAVPYRAMIGLGAIHWHAGNRELAADIWDRALALAAKLSPVTQALAQTSIDACRSDPLIPPC